MHVLVISTQGVATMVDTPAIPRIGESITLKNTTFTVTGVNWWPAREYLETIDIKWSGYPISVLVGAAAVIAVLTVAADRPANCRNRLRDEGKVYPRSGCDHCKTGGLTGCTFEM